MQFKRIEAQNFLSFHSMELDLENRGLILIDGDNQTETDAIERNGAGKSSMISAIFYAIYGELPNGEKADAVINRDVGKGTEVKLYFEKDGKDYLIHRGRKKNFTKVFQGETELTSSTMSATQTLIDTLIGIPKEVFMTTIYFDGHNSTPFSSLTDKQKKEYLETLVDIDVYRVAHELTKEDIKQLDSDVQATRAKIDADRNTLKYMEEKQKQEQARKNGLLNSVSAYDKQVVDLEEEKQKYLVSTSDQRATLREAIENAQRPNMDVYNAVVYQRDQLQQTVTKLRNEMMEIQRDTQTLDLKQQRVSMQIESDLAVVKEKMERSKEWQETTTCLVCGNVIDDEHKKIELQKLYAELPQYTDRINANRAELPIIEDEKSSNELKYNDFVNELQKVENDLSEVNARLTKLDNAQREAMANIQANQAQLQQLEQPIAGFDSAVETAKSNKQIVLGQLEHIVDDSDRIIEFKKQVKETELSISDAMDRRGKLQQALEAFSDKGIKSHVLDLVTPHLNEAVNRYLAKLTGSTILVEFSTQSLKSDGTLTDKFDVKVINNGEEATYASLSSGEKRRVDIAISLTLQDLVMAKSELSVNVLFYDELFEALDGIGSENVVELLKERLDSVDSIFVITHNESLAPLFNDKITVVKDKNGISTITE